MNRGALIRWKLLLLIPAMITAGCDRIEISKANLAGREPVIEPDYSGVTIPENIAPMNFRITEQGKYFVINITSSRGIDQTLKSSDGKVIFPLRLWRKLLYQTKDGSLEFEIISKDKGNKLIKYDPFRMYVKPDKLDPWLCYRILYPGYESWSEMQIMLRSTESFREMPFVENQLLDGNCMNCHSFYQNKPEKFLIHIRGSKGGTYFFDGNSLTRRMLRTENMKANVVYPSWHPSGRYVAFSSNRTVQSFHMIRGKNIEVTDLYSSLILYDLEKNAVFDTNNRDSIKFMETYPFWSPDGMFLYYCRTPQVSEEFDYSRIKYDLYRRRFNPVNGKFDEAELVFNASEIDKSVSFPSISPDGRFLVFTLHNYGTFSIWHREADLFMLDLQTMKCKRMDLNSDETESYHSWSANSKWLVFSSKRLDGLTARPFFSYIGSTDNPGKPFILPQKDPDKYRRMEKTFNRPELITGKPEIGPRAFFKASLNEPVKAKWLER